ncbi:MAG: hypothetical protein ACT4OM_13230 [Actinomycetota bacterium]
MSRKVPTPVRKPVKARGALPAPVTAPKRVYLPWYRRLKVQVGASLALIFLLVLAYSLISNFREGRESRRLEVRAIEQFERRISLLNAPLEAVFQQIQAGPAALQSGALPADQFAAQANSWVEEFRKLFGGIKEADVRPGLDALAEAKGLYVQGAVIYIDAAKLFSQAATLGAAERDFQLALANNLLNHGAAVATTGERRFQALKNEYGLNDPPAILPEVILPEEDAPPPIAPEVAPPADGTGPAASPEQAPAAGPEAPPTSGTGTVASPPAGTTSSIPAP